MAISNNVTPIQWNNQNSSYSARNNQPVSESKGFAIIAGFFFLIGAVFFILSSLTSE